MNKRVLAGIVIIVVTAVTVVFAAGLASGSLQPDVQQVTQNTDLQAVAENNLSLAKSPESFASIVNCDDEAKYGNISSYISFMTSHVTQGDGSFVRRFYRRKTPK